MSVQRTGEWVKTASPEQIVAAQTAGELQHYLGGKTPDEVAQDQTVAGTPDRVRAAAYGIVSMQGRGDLSSNDYEALRRNMDAAKLEKLNWVESASAAEVYAAEQRGDLNHLLGVVVPDPAVVAHEERLKQMQTDMAAIYGPK